MAPFKFNSKPPPLPPKDSRPQSPLPSLQRTPIYQQRNTQQSSSHVSLIPDSPVPSSPSVQHATRRANLPFAADSMMSNNSISDLLLPQENKSSASKRGLAFLKFPKRSPKSPPPPDTPILVANDEPDPPPPEYDDGISFPWNIQHNIHVDEYYVGLPPSWATFLAAAGIAAIHNRRAAGMRSPPDLLYHYNERPQSPTALASPQPSTSSTVPILTHPIPRTTFLSSSSSAPSLPSVFDLPLPLPLPAIFSPPQRSAQPSSASTPFPPTPYEHLPNTTTSASTFASGHKPNQASSSTIGSSSSNHRATQTANTTSANMSTSAAYAANPPSHSYANANTNPSYARISYSTSRSFSTSSLSYDENHTAYSVASSRTSETDYGLYYRRMALSQISGDSTGVGWD